MLIRNIIPKFLSVKLWGDRENFGKIPISDDPCWIEWQEIQTRFYHNNQRKGIGSFVNDSGYSVLKSIDLSDKNLLEFGPGDMRHHKFWNTKPKKFVVADIHDGMMQEAVSVFDREQIDYESYLISRNEKLPVMENSIDIILTFYSLEHLHPLTRYLDDMSYYLKPGGLIVGAIPTEGGLAWAVGRLLTSRRWLHKNTSINYDKLICWEHPNFADFIINSLDTNFERVFLKVWPIPLFPFLDTNLTFRFCYRNKI